MPQSLHQSVSIPTQDGALLSGMLVKSKGPSRPFPVVIFPATGISQRLYFPFALWLSAQGFHVLTVDMRGIGGSLAESHVKHCKARKQDWGEQDMPAALGWLLQETAAPKACVIGHSAGAQLVGLMPNHGKIHHLTAVAASTGRLATMEWRTRLMCHGLLNVLRPVSTAVLGYVPAKRAGWGEDLPAGVAQQWAQWCNSPQFIGSSFGKSIERHYYNLFSSPITVVTASDDRLVPRANIMSWLNMMPNAVHEIATLAPAEVGGKAIGHMDMFRRTHQALWPAMISGLLAALPS